MSGPFDAEQVRKLADILVDTGLTEIEVKTGEGSIRVVRAPAVQAASTIPVAVASAAAAPVSAAASAADAVEPPSENVLTSPMVGIAYLSSEPTSAPFVAPGQSVAAGQTLLLIEAMKTFNQIKAPHAGVVTRILIASGAPVEYGEPLLILE